MERSVDFYDREFIKEGKSVNQIAYECNTYPNKIRRELVKLGYKLRDKSEAQSIAIASGRHKHPTKGTKRPEDIKIKISEKVAASWEKVDDVEKARRTDMAKSQWKNMTEEERQVFKRAGAEAVRETAKIGSKLERFIVSSLTDVGYQVEFHRDALIPNEKLQIDIFLPEIKVAIEIDGPSHFEPIWGEVNLKRTMEADKRKNSLLITHGYVVIRIKNTMKTISEINKRDLFDNLIRCLNKIEVKFPDLYDRIITIELK